MKAQYLKSFDNTEIYTYLWDDVKNPIGVVQIFHGMAEHAFRYDEFAKVLNKAGYIVFADDHRAHGHTAKDEKLGVYSKGNCFLDIAKDEIFFSNMLKEKYKLPLYIFGHSYGSFVAQYYMTQTNMYEKIILCGSALMSKSLYIAIGRLFAKIQFKKRPHEPATSIEKINYKHYNNAVKTGCWLNSDKDEVSKFFADKYNGFALSNKFYADYFAGIKLAYIKKNRNKVDKTKPVLIISGSDDPVGHMSRSLFRLNKYCKNTLHIKHVDLKLYKGARHEILNEPNYKQDVYKDVIEFLKREY